MNAPFVQKLKKYSSVFQVQKQKKYKTSNDVQEILVGTCPLVSLKYVYNDMLIKVGVWVRYENKQAF